jgi:aminoglycoside phosphotransferase (APT) family kinase protein
VPARRLRIGERHRALGHATDHSRIIAEYARRSGRSVDAIDFYQVLALYKLAVISEGIYARYLQGKTLGEGFAGMHRSAGPLVQRALWIADSSSDRRLRAASDASQPRPSKRIVDK